MQLRTVLFVCTGNTCRSPMAEGIFNRRVQEAGLADVYEAASAGMFVTAGKPASFNSVRVSKSHGIDISSSRTKGLSDFSLDGCELILTMTLFQKEEILEMYPHLVDRVKCVAQWGFDDEELAVDIDDPFGSDESVYEATYDALDYYITQGVEALRKKMDTGAIIAIGSDHGGYELKEAIKRKLATVGCDVIDCGCEGVESVDYPTYAFKVGETVAGMQADFGVLICRTGVGMSIAANKVPGVRAALLSDPETAKKSRMHNDANVVCLGADSIDVKTAFSVVEAFLATPFEGARHITRLELIENYESRKNKR